MGGLIASITMVALRVIQILLFARAILSWFPHDNKLSGIMELLYNLTEPVLLPVRTLLFKIPGMNRFPLDFSLIIVYMIIELLMSFL